ncbi:MAG: AAA family ATPase [Ilumatobacteraceae bacterium]
MTSFIGRHAELALLAGLLEHRRLICITGVGGCGKTRLALASLEASAARFDRVVFVDVSGCTDGSSLATMVVTALGERPAPGVDAVDVLTATIGEIRSILVLDNCEHIVEVVGAFVERLLVRFATLVVVCTSREPLGLEGEAVLRVPPLDLPATDACAAEAVTTDASALFVDRARLADARFDAVEVWETIARICRRVDGLPLAIELAAARIGVLSVHDIAVGLDDRFRLLAGGPRTATLRHRSMTGLHRVVDPAPGRRRPYGARTAVGLSRILDVGGGASDGRRPRDR